MNRSLTPILALAALLSVTGCGSSQAPVAETPNGTGASPSGTTAADKAAPALTARLGDVRVSVAHVEIGRVPVLLGLRFDQSMSSKEYLQIDIDIENLSKSKEVEYVHGGWGDPLLGAQSPAQLRDDKWNAIYRVNISTDDNVGWVTVADQQTQGAQIAPGETIRDRLVYMPPDTNAQALTLSLPAQAIGQEGETQIIIPISRVERGLRSEPETEKTEKLTKADPELPQGDDFDADAIKLVAVDMSEAGLNLIIDAPEGSIAEKNKTSGDVRILNPGLPKFELALGPGRATPAIARRIWLANSENSTIGEVVQESADAIVARLDSEKGGKDYVMAATKTIGNVDLFVTTPLGKVEFRAFSVLPKSIALLQSRCAASLRPTDDFEPIDSLEKLFARGLRAPSSAGDQPLTRESTSVEAMYGAKLTDAMLPLLKGLPNLESLGLDHCRISDDGLKVLSEFTGLKSLGLDNGALSDYVGAMSAGELARLKALGNLDTLKLTFFKFDANDSALLGQFATLKHLNLATSRVDATALGELAKLSALETLNMSSMRLNDTAIPYLTPLKNLKQLTLNYNKFSPDGLEALHKAFPNDVLVTD
jgi:hypothetical protein